MYFTNHPISLYKFGNEKSQTAIQNLSVYVDIIDQIKDDANFYDYYNIQDGERPDTVSQDIYATVKYYWTLYLLNDDLRERGWPLTVQEIRAKAIKDYPNTILTTRNSTELFIHFQVGDSLVGQTSGATGVIIKRNLDLGQLVVKTTSEETFTNTELVRDNSDVEFPETIELSGSTLEYLAPHHYVDGNNERTDVDPYSEVSALLTPVTYLERYQKDNDNLRKLKIIKPNVIGQVVKAYQDSVRST
jgi:hypothetical protein